MDGGVALIGSTTFTLILAMIPRRYARWLGRVDDNASIDVEAYVIVKVFHRYAVVHR